MVENRAVDEFVWVVILVRWKQFTWQFSIGIGKCSQVIRETWSDFQTGKSTLDVLSDKLWADSCDVEVSKLFRREVAVKNTCKESSQDSILHFNFK